MNGLLENEAGEAGVWFRAIRPDQGDVPVAAARWILELRFAESDSQRAHELCVKAAADALSPAEVDQLDGLRKASAILEILHSKARQTLRLAGEPN